VFLLFAFASPAWAETNPACAAGRHQYTETRRVAATAMEDGEVTYLCSVCGQHYTEILYATDHQWGEWITDTPPTCTQPGEKHRTCNRGLSHDESAAIAALGHDYAASVTKEPGCGEEGTKTFTCSRCGDSYTEPIPVMGHDYEETDRREPGCVEDGLIVYTCAHNPAHTYEETIPAFGSHSFGDWFVETQPQEGAEGTEIRICVHDGFAEYRQMPALSPPATVDPPRSFPLMDVVLISTGVGLLGVFSVMIIPFVLGLLYIRKRRLALLRLKELRKEVEDHYGFK